ncbi:flotillin domain-containing protein, partial [Acinetobacter pecorum]
MLKFDLYNILIIAGIIFVALVTFGLIIARLYRRSSKEISFVRTGWGGEKVILGGGAIVLPVLHEIIPVNMNTLRLEVRRADDQALITRDRMRVDVMAEFYVRVKPTADSIATAAQTLGQKTMSPNELKNLVEGKFVDSLRAVAAEMAMEELHEKRVDFVQKVQQVVSEDLHKNGLELETVSLTGLDQTGFKYFNPQNAFDAEGLTKLTETIEDRRRKRNHIEQDTDLAIKTKNLEAEQARLQIIREEEYAKLQQEREIAIRRAEQLAEIAAQEAGKKREAEEAQIAAEREVELKRILAARDVENENIQKAQLIQKAQVEQKKTIELAEQDRAIAIAEKSRAESEAKAQADHARAQAVKAEEEVVTVRQIQQAERQKAVELVAAKEHAEKDAIAITVAAEAGKQAAADDAEAVRIAAEAEAEKVRLKAKGEADAKILLAQAMEKQYQVDAEGTRAVNEANNVLSPEQVEMQIRLAMLKYLPEIIRESVKPMENI